MSGPPQIFARSQAAAKWARARYRQGQAGGSDYIVRSLAEDVADRLDFMRFEAAHPLVVGDSTGIVRDALHTRGASGAEANLGLFDEEQPGPEEAFDLIVHLLGLGHVNDLPGALIHARNALQPGGLFLAAFPGAGSLLALREIALAADADRPAARMHPLVDNRAAAGLLQRAGFNRQVVDSFPVEVRYSSFQRMIGDLRDHGLTRSLMAPAPALTKQWLSRAEAAFDTLRDDQGKVPETFEILVLTGWK